MIFYLQLILSLVLIPDLTSAFGIDGNPVADNKRRFRHVESSCTFSRSIGKKSTSTLFDPPSKRTGIIPRTVSRTDIRLNAIIDIAGVSPEPIHSTFAFATFGPQPFWLLMILLPTQEITKKTMGKMGETSLHCVIYCDHRMRMHELAIL